MVMLVDHSSGGFGAFGAQPLEPPEPEFAPPVPPPAPPPAPPAPSNWVAELPPAVFGPPAPHPSELPVPTVLAALAPPPAVSVIETPAVAPVVAPVVASTPAATTAAAAPTAPAMEIATLELTLADPLNQELIHHHGGALPVLDLANLNPVLQEQVDRYGASLTARLMQLAQANAAVRDLYLQSMDQAAQNLGPDTMGAVFVPGIAGNRGDNVPDSWRFDPVAFTQAYAQAGQQDGAPLAQRAFVATYGTDALQAWEQHHAGDAEFTERGFTLAGSFELSAPTLADLDGHPNRERMGWTGASLNADSHGLHPLSLQAPPELHNAQAVWFDATLGWVTPSENIVVKQDFLDKAMPVVFIGVMTWATAGAFGIAGGAGVATGTGIGAGTGVLGAMTAGAAFGAIGGFYGGLVNEGRIDLGGMFRGALTGAITAGVVRASGLDSMGITTSTNGQGQQIVTSIDYAQRALAVTGQATLQGALQQISGGEFVDGFTSGLAQGLGAEVARGLQLQIDTLSASRSIDATQAGALRQFARVAQSAVSLLGNPDDPGHAFAMTFVNGLVSDVQQGLTDQSHGDSASPVWATAPDETTAETARLARQNESPAATMLLSTPSAATEAFANALSTSVANMTSSASGNAVTSNTSSLMNRSTYNSTGTSGMEADGETAQTVVITGQRAPWLDRAMYRLENMFDPESNAYVNWARDYSILGAPSRILGGLEAVARGPAGYDEAGQPVFWNERMQGYQQEVEIALDAASIAMFPTSGPSGLAVSRSGLVVGPGAPGRLAELRSQGHGLERHGGAVSDGDLVTRAYTGVAPDGSMLPGNRTPDSTAFFSDGLLVQADDFLRQNALPAAIASAAPGQMRVGVSADMGFPVGRGYLPVGRVVGLDGPLLRVENITSVEAWYRYNPSSGTWDTTTIYPLARP